MTKEEFKVGIDFYKCKQSGEVLSEEEVLDSVDDDYELGSFYLIGTFNTKEEALNHLKHKHYGID